MATLNNLVITTTSSKKKVNIATHCMDCDNVYTKKNVDLSALLELQGPSRRPVQHVFPDFSRDERELFFQSGLCTRCYAKLLVFCEEDL